MKSMDESNYSTICYYNNNAFQYFENTLDVDMTEAYDRFIRHVVIGGRIIDIGAGSGRDLKFFKNKGYDVEGIDASIELCRLASEFSGIDVKCIRIQDWIPKDEFDGIWANASLLHLSIDEFESFINMVEKALKTGGACYFSLKTGIDTGLDSGGRYYRNYNESEVDKLLSRHSRICIVEKWVSDDLLDRVDMKWINRVLTKIK